MNTMKVTDMKHSENDSQGEVLVSTLENLNLEDRKESDTEEQELVTLTNQLNIESKKDWDESPESDEDNEEKSPIKKEENKLDKESEKVQKNEPESDNDNESKDEDTKEPREKDEKKNNKEKEHDGELKERGGPMRSQPLGQHRVHPYTQEMVMFPPCSPPLDYYAYSEPSSPNSCSSLSGPSTPTSPQQEVPDLQVRNAIQEIQLTGRTYRQEAHDDLLMEDGLPFSYVGYIRNNFANVEEIRKFDNDFRDSKDKVYKTDEDGDTMLMCLIANSYPTESIYALVELVNDEKPHFINWANKKSQTALYTAVYYDKWDLVGYLIERGANPNLPNNRRGDTPLHFACRKGYIQSVKALLTAIPGDMGYQVDVNKPNKQEETPLEIALKYHSFAREEIVQLLVRCGARSDVEHSGVGMDTGPNYKSLLEFLIRTQEVELLRICLESSNDPTKLVRFTWGDWDQTTLLHHVVTNDKMPLKDKAEVIQLLLSYGADPNVRDYRHYRPIDYVLPYEMELTQYL